MQPILEIHGVTKSFFGNQVLKGVDFEVCAGEVMGLAGENGAGKSTLMKIITGLYTHDGGEILYEGKPVNFSDPSAAKSAGLSILLIFSELSEALGVSDRIVVMCRGRIAGEYVNKNLEQDVLLKAASTVRVEELA